MTGKEQKENELFSLSRNPDILGEAEGYISKDPRKDTHLEKLKRRKKEYSAQKSPLYIVSTQ